MILVSHHRFAQLVGEESGLARLSQIADIDFDRAQGTRTFDSSIAELLNTGLSDSHRPSRIKGGGH
jgi:hypothetical protein